MSETAASTASASTTAAAAATAPAATATAPLKSPPLAFEKTPNDALFPPTEAFADRSANLGSPPAMGRQSPLAGQNVDLQVLVAQQSTTLQLLHEAFAAERRTWSLEKDWLYQRIGSLEQLLKSGNHYSPAKSPISSPSPSGGLISPSSARPLAASQTLPTIAEDESSRPLSARRDGAPQSIQLPGQEGRKQSVVSFTDADGFHVEEIPPPPVRTTTLSPPPLSNRILAGHTPVRIPRPPTPPPQKMSFDGIEDTPTRNNTHINALLTQSNDDEEDPELKGPLNMPELPHEPDATNFTLEMLSKKLEAIEKHPETAKPMVFAQPSPGLASPVDEKDIHDDISPGTRPNLLRSADTEAPFVPPGSRKPETVSQSELSSTALSPTNGAALSPQEAQEAKVQADFEQGGIKLKKKTSINFGAPLGVLAGFAPRRPSQDKS